MSGSLGWAVCAVLCAVIWPALLAVMYRVAVTVLSAEARERRTRDVRRQDSGRIVGRQWPAGSTEEK